MSPKPEVLSPAGSPESLTAAVRAGADAVYLGASRFSARAGAKNFGPEELKSAVEYCHARDVKVYLAVNTLLLDGELSDAAELVRSACSLPVDALLVQDMGLLRLLCRCAPALRLHASTQTGVHTAAGASALLAAGFRRVVLARELSLAEIADIHARCPIELETFVHGAQCMSVSGQCYFSSVLGSRSGNRGLCAQPCRLPFSAPGGTGHDLSLSDLSMISRAGELARAGSVCLKIEGRLKRPEYVAAATRACRLAADGQKIPQELLDSLAAVFSRSGFTTGYADGERGRGMFGVRSKEDVTGATEAVLRGLRGYYCAEAPKIAVDFTLKIPYNKPAFLLARDAAGSTARAEGPAAEPARTLPLTEDFCAEHLKKTGGTPFFARDFSCEIGEGLSLPVSELNRMRREVLAELLRLRAVRPAVPFSPALPEPPEKHRAGTLRLRARFSGTDLPEAAKSCELVYVPYAADPHLLARLLENGFPIGVELPRGLFGIEDPVRRRLELAKAAGVRDVWAGNLDGAAIALACGLRVHGGFTLNITNTQALEWYREFGLADAELSPELKLSQAAAVGGALPRGLLLYGRIPLMLCRCCPAANSPRGCLHCKTPPEPGLRPEPGWRPELTDRRGMKFPIQCLGACSEVLNSVPLYLADRLADVKNADFGLLRFSTESPEEAGSVIGRYLSAREGGAAGMEPGTFTRGLSYRGME